MAQGDETLSPSYGDKDAHYFANARLEILPLLPIGLNKVLEVGAANGATLAYIKDHWHGVKTVAVEPFAAPETASTN
jgi:hypothetical protein